jgi:cell division protein FtsQ
MRGSLTIIKYLLVATLVVLLYSFTTERNMKRKITKIDIEFVDENRPFITLNMVNKLLIQSQDNVTSINKESLDLKEVENRLLKNPMIRDAQVYLSVDGVLGAKIEQRTPIARVAGSPDYYLDADGMKMPLSEFYTARVPLINGSSKLNFEEVTELLLIINEDPFMKNSVVGLNILEDKGIILQLRKLDFKVYLGKIEGVEKKFQNFKAFYQKSKQDNTLKEYKLVNLEYLSQVVATKL